MKKHLIFKEITNKEYLKPLFKASDMLLKEFDRDAIETTEFVNCGDLDGVLIDEGVTSLNINAYNLYVASKNSRDILCYETVSYSILNDTNREISSNETLKKIIETKLKPFGVNFANEVTIRTLLDIIVDEIGLDAIKERVKHPFKGFKVAIHSGNNLFDDSRLDMVLEAIGAEVVRLESCHITNAYELMDVNEDVALRIAGETLLEMFDNNIDIVTSMDAHCFLMFDYHQKEIECKAGRDIDIPFLNIAQLLLLAMGFTDKQELGLDLHKVQPTFI
jgi:succinate dehydrogenase / fumarate reductase cytochrome b subunit